MNINMFLFLNAKSCAIQVFLMNRNNHRRVANQINNKQNIKADHLNFTFVP